MIPAFFGLAEDLVIEDRDSQFQPARLNDMGAAGQEEFWRTLALRHTKGLGVRSQARLLKYFGSATSACAQWRSWSEAKVDEGKALAFSQGCWQAKAQEEWRKAAQCGAKLILWQSDAYPRLLRELADAPPFLYAIGDVTLLAGPCVAVVGSRSPTANGRKCAVSFGCALSAAGITVVSGVALGIDRQAHLGALREPGKTIGVLGTGIDVVYPATNRDVFASIIEEGLLISEFAPGCAPAAANFPIRNRIISGLSLGVIVVEAASRSGSLVTARLALEQNREVFAIPGPALDCHAAGCQNLVRQGARPVFYPEDVLRDLAGQLKLYGSQPVKKAYCQPPNPPHADPALPGPYSFPGSNARHQGLVSGAPDEDARKAAKALLHGGLSDLAMNRIREAGIIQMDALASATGIGASELTAVLLGLELAGKIKRLPGARYACA